MNAQLPTVTVAVPVLNESAHIEACLTSIVAQTYPAIVEILVIDGGSDDETRFLASAFPQVQLLENPRRIQATALNIAIDQGRGDLFVRVDGHCRLAPDYVERCVEALAETGAAMVGGAMAPMGEGWIGKGIAAALSSRLGAGPARFHIGGASRFVDTVYLGAFRRQLAREAGGYAEEMATNEDAEFAVRMRPHGGIWFDSRINSTYTPRRGLRQLARQFYRYGKGRADTVRRHPRSLSPRQVAAPVLVLGLLSPWRLTVLGAYTLILGSRSLLWICQDRRSFPGFLLAVPAMHLPWGAGFLLGLMRPSRPAS